MNHRRVGRWLGMSLLALCATMTGGPALAKTVLTIAPWGGMGDKNQGGLLEQYLAEYQKLRPDIEFQVLSLPMNSYDGLPKLLLLPEMPDIVETHLSLLPELMKAGVPAPAPTDVAQRARRFFFRPVLQPMEQGGRLYGLPTEYQLYALAYNQRVFAEEGFAGPPQTWPELRLLAAKGSKLDANGRVIRWGFGFPGGWAGHGEASTHAFLALLWSNNGTYLDEEGRPHLTDPPALETIQFLADLALEKLLTLNGWGNLPNNTVFMAIAPSWSRSGYVSAMKDDFANAATSLIPHGKGTFATTQYGWGFIVPSKAKNAREAWEFLSWLTMQEGPNGLTRTGLAMARLGSVPTNPQDLRNRPELNKELFWRGFMQGMNVARPEPGFPRIMVRWKELGKALEPVLQGRVPPPQGAAEAQKNVLNALTGPEPAGGNT